MVRTVSNELPTVLKVPTEPSVGVTRYHTDLHTLTVSSSDTSRVAVEVDPLVLLLLPVRTLAHDRLSFDGEPEQATAANDQFNLIDPLVEPHEPTWK
jgi:hypothetical protein